MERHMRAVPGVFVVEDDQTVRTALVRLIATFGHPVRGFGTASDFLGSEYSHQPGCLLLDFLLPDMNGMELQERLNAQHSSVPIIFLSGVGDIPLIVRVIKSGAVDFLTKPVRDTVLSAAIENALKLDEARRARLSIDDEVRARIDSLTPREHAVLDGVLIGSLNKQIARHLGISEKTVKVHRGRVMTKMGVRHVAHLARLAAQVEYELPQPVQVTPSRSVPIPAWRRRQRDDAPAVAQLVG
jgi:two-component system, LuxR family, response regulator FixJ